MKTIRIVVFVCLINYGNCQNDTQVQGRSSVFSLAQWTAWSACTAGESCSWKRQHSCSIHHNPSGTCGTRAWKEETMACDRCIGAGNNVWIPQGQWSGCFGTGCSDTIQTQMFKCWNHDTQPTCKRKLTRFCPSNLVCDGTWSSWERPTGTQCTVRCGGGLEVNTRQCYKNGRESYNCDTTATYQIALIETGWKTCNLFDCNAVRYTEWGECVCTNGISRRTRQCLANCNGANQESQTCNNPTCTTTTTTTTTVIPTTVTTPIVTTSTTTTTTTQTTTSTIATTTTAEDYGRINKEIPEIETTATTLEYEHDAQEPTLKSWVNRIIIIAVSALVVGFLASIAIFILCCRKKFKRKRVVYIAGDQTDEVAQYNTLDIQSTLPPVQLYESMTSIHRPSLPNRPLPRTPTSISSSTRITPSSTIRPPKPPRRNRPNSRPDMNIFFDTLAPPSNPPDTPQMAVSAPVSPTLTINNADVQYSSLRKISGTPDPYLAPIN